MKAYLAMFDDGRGWQPMKRVLSASRDRLCIYETYDGATRAIRGMKFKYKDETEFKIVTLGVVKDG